ncbi:MAG TPA: MlaD family protein [Methylomirabilota bacterium]|nr:MlaD family protein [Methylomirabilota bacterium]
MADERRYALQLRIGTFILVSLGVFFAIVYLLGARARYFESKYEIAAEFSEVAGLIEGATVRLAGVQIGRVTSVVLATNPGGKVRVTMTVARRFHERIRENSEARIATQGLLGDKIVDITPGTPEAPPVRPGATINAQDPQEMSRMFAEGARTLQAVSELATTLRAAADRLDKGGTFDDIGAAVKSARRITDEVEKGKGWLHVLVYEEPEALRRLNGVLASTQQLISRAESGDNAVSVLLSKESAKSARALLAALDALGRAAEKPGPGDGLLPALLFDPEYRPVARDLQLVARNFREISEKLARGEGLLGGMLQDTGQDGLGQAGADFRAAMANLRVVSDKVAAGEGTLGALVEDPTVYENLVTFLEGAQRSLLLRSLVRSTIHSGQTAREK